jgi:hypothetical protein
MTSFGDLTRSESPLYLANGWTENYRLCPAIQISTSIYFFGQAPKIDKSTLTCPILVPVAAISSLALRQKSRGILNGIHEFSRVFRPPLVRKRNIFGTVFPHPQLPTFATRTLSQFARDLWARLQLYPISSAIAYRASL